MVMLSPTILFAPQQTLADLRRENKEREPHFAYCYAAVTRVGQLRTKTGGPLFAIVQEPYLFAQYNIGCASGGDALRWGGADV
jgi:hypothetical protein